MPESSRPADQLMNDPARLTRYSDDYNESLQGVEQGISDVSYVMRYEADPIRLAQLASQRLVLGQRHRTMEEHYRSTLQRIGRVAPPTDADVQNARTAAQRIADQTADAASINATIALATALAGAFIGLHS